MMQQLINWLGDRLFPNRNVPEPGARPTPVRVRPVARRRSSPNGAVSHGKEPRLEADIKDRIEDGGPGKNVLVRSKFVREDSGTHEVLKIVDESLLEADDGGIDPYNTGRFDRSKNWTQHYRK